MRPLRPPQKRTCLGVLKTNAIVDICGRPGWFLIDGATQLEVYFRLFREDLADTGSPVA